MSQFSVSLFSGRYHFPTVATSVNLEPEKELLMGNPHAASSVQSVQMGSTAIIKVSK